MECVPSSYNTYFEPFAGSASLFFDLLPQRAVISDINSELITAYQVIREQPRAAHCALAEMKPLTSEYYRIRSLNPSSMSRFDRSIRFLYLNRYGFNGIYRTNRQGQFNVPMGSRSGTLPTIEEYVQCASILKTASLRTWDYRRATSRATRNDLVYLDPPYATAIRPRYGEYGYASYSATQLKKLIARLHDLDDRGVKVILSYSAEPELLEALSDWGILHLSIQRTIAANNDKRMRTIEILATNSASTAQLSSFTSADKNGISSLQLDKDRMLCAN